MTPAVLNLVEGLRAKGELFGRFGHVVARDACLEAGCVLRVTSNRAVNVRKSNRPPKPMTIHQDGPQFFQFAPADAQYTADGVPFSRLARAQEMIDADLLAARDLAAAINAPPRAELRNLIANVVPRASIPAQLRPPEGTTYHMPLDVVDFFRPENGFGFFGREWDSDRIFRELAN